MKLTQVIAASISSGAAVLLLSAALISQAAPVPVTRASLEEALEPRGVLNTISEVLDGVRSSHIDDTVKTPSLDEIIFGSSVPRRANTRETKKRQAPAGVQPAQPPWPSLRLAHFEKGKEISLRRQLQNREGNRRYRMRKQDVKGVEKGLYELKDLQDAQVLRLPGPEAKSKNPAALASRERRRLERARREADPATESFSRPPSAPVMPVRVKRKSGGQLLDDGADEKMLRHRQMHREAMRRYRVRAKAFKDIETGQRIADDLIAVPKRLAAGRKIVLNTPEAERKRERVRATRRRKKEAKANAESQVGTSEPISAARKITPTSSKRRKVQSSTASPEGVRQESLEAEHFKVPDLNLPPPG